MKTQTARHWTNRKAPFRMAQYTRQLIFVLSSAPSSACPCGVPLQACHHCHPLRRDLPRGCSNRLILYNIRVKPWCSRPRTIWAMWSRSSAKYPWSLIIIVPFLIENVVKENHNGHSTSSILQSGVDGWGGYGGKEVLKSSLCTDIFLTGVSIISKNCFFFVNANIRDWFFINRPCVIFYKKKFWPKNDF